jgi:hypothetical protein
MNEMARSDKDGLGVCHIEDESRLLHLLSEMGLVEQNADGGWDFTKALEAGSLLFVDETRRVPAAAAGVVVPLRPRRLQAR